MTAGHLTALPRQADAPLFQQPADAGVALAGQRVEPGDGDGADQQDRPGRPGQPADGGQSIGDWLTWVAPSGGAW